MSEFLKALEVADDKTATLADRGHVEEAWFYRGVLAAMKTNVGDLPEPKSEGGQYAGYFNAGYKSVKAAAAKAGVW